MVRNSLVKLACLFSASVALSTAVAGPSSKVKILHTFSNGNDGAYVLAGLAKTAAGDLIGTTDFGGGVGCSQEGGCGTVFLVSPRRQETVLHAFSGGSDGGNPYGGVFVDSSGNAYGTTAGGGASDSGVIFKLDANSAEAVLYNFCSLQNCTDGAFPQAAPIMDGDGNLYGTTQTGGVKCRAIKGCGTVYRLTPSGSETVLHAFTDSEGDGSYPESGLVMNRKGDLFGVTGWGGNDMCGGGCGIVFKVSPGGKETILHTFTGQEDGFHSLGSLVSDKAGNLYGTTFYGGISNPNCNAGSCGTIFKIAPNGTKTLLYSFNGPPTDGANPTSALTLDKFGNLYGVTGNGGNDAACSWGCGLAFELAADGTETVLYTFCSKQQCSDGIYPLGGLLAGRNGVFYGTTSEGGSATCKVDNTWSCGTVFELRR
ncbi:MAG TPA: choice-of-anchor tandem repeat GloVer-containing protein [Rhizomicrobium sp.]|jgi:uncharacterized repeat protein (TIGR03803 family)